MPVAGTKSHVTKTDRSRGRIARLSLWALLALSIPYALMMTATGIFFGLWNAPDPVLTIVWILVVSAPIWLALMLVICRRHPGSANYVAIVSWLTAAALLTYVYG